MLNFLSIIFALLAVIVFLMIVYTLAPVLKGGGGFNVLLPSLGIVISVWFLLALLVLVELFLIAVAVLLAR